MKPEELREQLKTMRDWEYQEGNVARVERLNRVIDYIYETEAIGN